MMRSVLLLVLLTTTMSALSSCTGFQEQLPKEVGSLTYLDDKRSEPVLTSSMRQRQKKLTDAEAERIQKNFAVFAELLDSSRSFRTQLQRRRDLVASVYKSEGRVTAVDAELVLEAAHWFIELDALLYQLWLTWRDYLPHASEPDPYAPYRGARLYDDDVRAKGGLLALAAEVLRLENATIAVALLDDTWALTQWLNVGDESRGIEMETYDRIVGSLYDPEHRVILQKQLKRTANARLRMQSLSKLDGEVAVLMSFLDRSPLAAELKEEGGTKRQWKFSTEVSRRAMASLFAPWVEAYISSIYDNTQVEEAESIAKLADHRGIDERLMDHLAPLDVVFVRDLRRQGAGLGYTHAVVYVGRDDQWRTSRFRDHPFARTYLKEMRNGRRFFGLGGTGPQLIRLEDLLEGHDLLVVRYQRDTDPLTTPAMTRLVDMVQQPIYMHPPHRRSEQHSVALLQHVFSEGQLGMSTQDLRIDAGLRPLIAQLLADDDVLIARGSGKLLFGTTNATPVAGDKDLKKEVRAYMEARTPLTVSDR